MEKRLEDIGGLSFSRHRLASEKASCPSVLKIEAACDAVDIDDFACKVDMGAAAALHRLEINFRKFHAAAGYEFIFIGALALNMERGLVEHLAEGL